MAAMPVITIAIAAATGGLRVVDINKKVKMPQQMNMV
jgi:hypothetical protein